MTQAPCKQALHDVSEAPPSVETVFCTLYAHKPMTGADIRKATGLPRRTVYSALQRLRDLGVLKEQLSLRDTRQTFFWLDDAKVAAAAS